jgi:hypothetical protein
MCPGTLTEVGSVGNRVAQEWLERVIQRSHQIGGRIRQVAGVGQEWQIGWMVKLDLRGGQVLVS